MTRKLFALALFTLILTTGAALADEATPATETTEPAAPAAGQCQPGDLADPTLDSLGSAQQLTTFCSAECEDGSTISVSCNGTCGATDQNCDFGVRGRVTCNGTTTSSCPVCPVVCPETHCPDGTILQCPPGTSDCQGGGQLCYVECDGQFQFCPGHFGKITC